MSNAYNMLVRVEGFDAGKRKEIKAAAEGEWDFDDWSFSEGAKALFASGDSSLCGVKSEEEFVARLANAIFKANGKKCEVEVVATCLEDWSFETYMFGEGEDEDDV